jgi:hypothetical protein
MMGHEVHEVERKIVSILKILSDSPEPVVFKVCAIRMASLATQLIMGKKVQDFGLKNSRIPHYGAKESVFLFNMFPEADPVLRPELKSTGEVLFLDVISRFNKTCMMIYPVYSL